MRRFLAIAFALLLPTAANAEKPYVPRFARVEEPASVPNFSLLCRMPEYPKASLRNEEQGVTTLRITVGPDGRAIATRIAKSSGFIELDKAAEKGLASCAFKPASVDGVPVQSATHIQYKWTFE